MIPLHPSQAPRRPWPPEVLLRLLGVELEVELLAPRPPANRADAIGCFSASARVGGRGGVARPFLKLSLGIGAARTARSPISNRQHQQGSAGPSCTSMASSTTVMPIRHDEVADRARGAFPGTPAAEPTSPLQAATMIRPTWVLVHEAQRTRPWKWGEHGPGGMSKNQPRWASRWRQPFAHEKRRR